MGTPRRVFNPEEVPTSIATLDHPARCSDLHGASSLSAICFVQGSPPELVQPTGQKFVTLTGIVTAGESLQFWIQWRRLRPE